MPSPFLSMCLKCSVKNLSPFLGSTRKQINQVGVKINQVMDAIKYVICWWPLCASEWSGTGRTGLDSQLGSNSPFLRRETREQRPGQESRFFPFLGDPWVLPREMFKQARHNRLPCPGTPRAFSEWLHRAHPLDCELQPLPLLAGTPRWQGTCPCLSRDFRASLWGAIASLR